MLSKSISVVFQFILLVGVVIFYLLVNDGFYSMNSVYILLSVVAGTLIIFFSTEEDDSLRGYYYRPFLIFLFGYFVVFFQRYIDLALGLIGPDDAIFLKPSLIVKTLCMSTAGYIVLILGYTLYQRRSDKSLDSHRVIYDVAFMRNCFRFAFVIFVLFKAESLLRGEYSQEELEQSAGGMSNYASILTIVTYMSLLSVSLNNSVVAGDKTIWYFLNEFGKSNIVITIIICLLYLIAGSRSHPFVIICSFGFALCYIAKQRIALWKIVVVVLIASSFLSFIGATRGEKSASLERKLEIMQLKEDMDNTILPSTLELSGSLYTFVHAVDYVPKQHDYLYGSFHFRNLLSTIPFSSRVTSQFLNQDKRYTSSDFFITHIIQGDDYTYGNGTCLNADLYLNYGFAGIIICLFLLGWFMRSVEWNVFVGHIPSLIYLLFSLYIAGYVVIYSRFGFLGPINYIAFSLLLNYYCKHYRSHFVL